MARYLVTGGAGFIGSNLVAELVKRAEQVRVIDNLSTGRKENLSEFEGKIELIVGDIRDMEAVGEAIRGVDYVLHQAALASVQRSIDDPATTSEVNIQGTINLLEAARRNGVKRFVYASSSSVYGDSEELPKHEGMLPRPKSPYAVSKLSGEWYCRNYSELFSLPTICLRYFNVFGPKQDPSSQYSAVIPIFIKCLLRGQRPTIFGDGEQSRDFTYVDNVVQANLAACSSDHPSSGVYNVAAGSRFTLKQLLAALQRITGSDIDPRFSSPRPGDVRHSQASIEAASRDLGYEVAVDFEDGLARTVDWFRGTEV